MDKDIHITPNLVIGGDEISFMFSRSGGPGGQNVNKVESRVTLLFDFGNSTSLNDTQKELLGKKLKTRIDKNGILRMTCSKTRSQLENRQIVIERFQTQLAQGLKRRKPRRKTATPESAIKRRLENKKHQSLLKKKRGRQIDADE